MRDNTALKKPLHGIKIVDLTRVLSGPFCTMILGDLGADVIKIESPDGDPIRHQGTLRDGFSWYYASFNRNKRSVVIDLRHDEGRNVVAELIRSADVLVENFRPGVLEKLGFDQENLKRLNPQLIAASVNGFGSSGPYAQRPAFDFIAQAMSGLMSVNGEEDGEPLRVAPPITDLISGLYLSIGILAALRARELNGTGQRVEVSLTNSAISMLAYLASEFFTSGTLPARTGNDHPIAAPYGLFNASDGKLAIAPSNEAILRRFLEAVGLNHILDDPRYETNSKRMSRRRDLHKLIDKRLLQKTKDEWVTKLNAAGVPCCRVYDLSEVFSDPQILGQEMVIDVEHPARGPVRILGFPIKLSETPCGVRMAAPELGEHTESILASIGLAARRVEN